MTGFSHISRHEITAKKGCTSEKAHPFLNSFLFCCFLYKKIYLQTNSTASTYINGVIFFLFPQIRLIST